jgi:hypothetical protein
LSYQKTVLGDDPIIQEDFDYIGGFSLYDKQPEVPESVVSGGSIDTLGIINDLTSEKAVRENDSELGQMSTTSTNNSKEDRWRMQSKLLARKYGIKEEKDVYTFNWDLFYDTAPRFSFIKTSMISVLLLILSISLVHELPSFVTLFAALGINLLIPLMQMGLKQHYNTYFTQLRRMHEEFKTKTRKEGSLEDQEDIEDNGRRNHPKKQNNVVFLSQLTQSKANKQKKSCSCHR